ncbi:MAG: anthranilate synthase component I [Lachnospiraceae bacterium]|nr:anthranilate synthase component I [Lachnospiraceae bacterium]
MKRKLRAYKKTVSIVNETAISMFEGIAKGQKSFLLESYDKNYDRYSFFGINPEEIITSKGNSLAITNRNGEVTVREGNPLERLEEYYSEFEVTKDDGELAMIGGLVGSMAYDFVRYTEVLPDENPDEIGIETIQLMLTKEFISIDHMAETLTGVVLDEDNAEGRTRGETKAAELVEQVFTNRMEMPKDFHHDGKIVKMTDTVESYSRKVDKIKEYIREGHIFQTVLSQRWTIETKQSGIELYKELRELNPSPYLYYFNFGEFEIIGSSPEMLVKQTDNKVLTCPIAGTRRRGKNEEEDQLLRDELLQDEKERAEHVMLVDLARNDMGRIAEFGTVKVTQFMQVQNYSHVMHIVSLVEGKKRGTLHPMDLIASFLPAGTLSGAPKIRAMEIIDELETVRRGLYGGATGYLGFNGNMDFCITIRTMIKKGNRVYLQAGAGIVADSIGESEYMECCNKVMALAKTLVEEENL